MDSYKRHVIKAGQIIDSGKAVPLTGAGKGTSDTHSGKGKSAGGASSAKHEPPAEKIFQLTESQIKKIQQEAYTKGHADGLQVQSKDIAAKLDVLTAATKTIPQIKKDILQKGEEQMVKLAIAIAERILHQEVTTRKEVIIEVLKSALKNITETDGMKVRLNPQDFRYMMEVKKDFLQSFDGIRNIVFEEDTSVKRGGAVVETLFGEVDARLESQLKEIKSAIMRG
ncbi:MAG TPA: FliH/SctL family protein [Smithellaceae bacterium]|nr:FliH/SctL family protein [Smithellaceae bacterium]HQM45103.1 FliH/SctL family protein [Smithellaceae bacterium]